MTTYKLEPGRTIAINGRPAVYLTIVTSKESGMRGIEPADADALATRIVALLNHAAAKDA